MDRPDSIDLQAMGVMARQLLPEPWRIDAFIGGLLGAAERRDFARFHYRSVGELVGNDIDDVGSSFAKYMLTLEDRAEKWLPVQANLVACVQSMHAMWDNLAHAAFFGAGDFDGSGAKLPLIYAHALADDRKPLLPSELRDLFKDAVSDPLFAYLAAVNNTLKHRRLLKFPHVIDFRPQEGRSFGLQIPAFEYKGAEYPSEWLAPKFAEIYDFNERSFHAIVRTLDHWLKRQVGDGRTVLT